MIYTLRLEGGRWGVDDTKPICVYGFAGKEINDPLFLFGFNEVGIEGLHNICFALLCLSSSSTHCISSLVTYMQYGWQRTQVRGGNSPLSRREVWSGRWARNRRVNPSSLTTLEELPWVNDWGKMGWRDRLGWKHNMWPPHVLHTKRPHWLTINWTLGPPIKATAQKATGEKTRAKHTHLYTLVHMHTLSSPSFPWDFIKSKVKGLQREKGSHLSCTHICICNFNSI